MHLFDSHAHLTSPQLSETVDELIKNASEVGVTQIINICTDQKSMNQGLKIAEKYSHIFNAGATTPHDVEKIGEEDFPFFEKLAREKKLVAIGETGLDYFYEHSDKKTQKSFLVRYLHLAEELSLPVIIHCRDAFSDLFSIVDKEYKGSLLLHCFTGTTQEAEEVLKRGWMLSLSGIVTFKKSEQLREVAKIVPKNQLLIETDAPYLAPGKYRGKTNEPAFLTETLKVVAETRGDEIKDLGEQTRKNAEVFFKLSE